MGSSEGGVSACLWAVEDRAVCSTAGNLRYWAPDVSASLAVHSGLTFWSTLLLLHESPGVTVGSPKRVAEHWSLEEFGPCSDLKHVQELGFVSGYWPCHFKA